jgi:hypothetical protein
MLPACCLAAARRLHPQQALCLPRAPPQAPLLPLQHKVKRDARPVAGGHVNSERRAAVRQLLLRPD